MIPHVKMNDGTVILQLATGVKVISRQSFNYKKILDRLDTHTEEDILPLLVTPPLPDGVYHLHQGGSMLYVNHYSDKGNSTKILSAGNESTTTQICTFLGPYASIEDIKDDYPEYFI